jgi:CheY-like chemotaxis protein
VKNIYFIDDDPVFVYLTRRMMNSSRSTGFEAREFADGEMAIDHLRAISDRPDLLPDIIFLDLSMPVMDGWEFLEEYSQLRGLLQKNITLFIVSSSISPEEIERSKTYSAVTDFLIKPLRAGKIEELLAAL